MTAAATSGVVTRTVGDTAALLDVLSVVDPGAWNVAPPAESPFVSEVKCDPGRLRIRVTSNNALGVEAAPECVEAVRITAARLTELGHDVVESDPVWPDPGEFLMGFLTVWSTIAAGIPDLDVERIEAHNRANWDQAVATNAIEFSEAEMMLQRQSRVMTEQFGRDFDVLVTPTMGVEPLACGAIWNGIDENPGAPVLNATPMAAYTAIYNVTGQPALSLPLHLAESGLPVGVQFAAAPWHEALLIRLGSQIEEEYPWINRWPDLARS